MSPQSRLEAIRARLEAATPGPWEHKEPHVVLASGGGLPMTMGNAELIAHAPDDLAWLLAAQDRMRAALEHVASEIEGQVRAGTLSRNDLPNRIYWTQVASVARAALAETPEEPPAVSVPVPPDEWPRMPPPDAPDAPRDWVRIEPQVEGQAANLLHHRHNSGAACAACEIERLRETIATVGMFAETAGQHFIAGKLRAALGASRPGEPQP